MLKFKIVNPTPMRTVIKVRGEFSNSKVIEPGKEIKKVLLEMPKKSTLAFEASEISHIDSMGISTLVSCYDIAKEKGIVVEIQNPSQHVLKMLKLVKLEKLFRIIN